MGRLKILVVCLMLASSPAISAEPVDYTTLTLEQLEAVDRDGLSKDERKRHKKALKKARKIERKKNRPAKPYCNRMQKSKGLCS